MSDSSRSCLSFSDKKTAFGWVNIYIYILFFLSIGQYEQSIRNRSEASVCWPGGKRQHPSQTKKSTNYLFFSHQKCAVGSPIFSLPHVASLWLFCTAECVFLGKPAQLFTCGLEQGRRQQCFLLCDGKLYFRSLFPAPLLPPPPHRPKGSADLGSVALLHQPLLVVCLAQDHVVLQKKLVSHTKPVQHKDKCEGGVQFT